MVYNMKDFFASPALSLSLAGVFRGGVAREAEVEEGEEESCGGGGRAEETTVEISSENTGPGRSDEGEDEERSPEEGEEDEEEEEGKKSKKRRKTYHRHTAQQIREMETLFKESPHPDEKQRQQLSKRLGLAPRQVKFWFQNRRTQIKAIQERHENSLLKSEIDKLREENRNLRESKKKACCPNCGFSGRGGPAMVAEEQQLKNENARLKSEVEKLRGMVGRFSGRASPPNFSSSMDNEQHIMNSIQHEDRFFGLEKSKISDIVDGATSELLKMATTGEPLWVRSIEARRDILDYNVYIKEFLWEDTMVGQARRSIEASRESGVVFLDAPRLVQAFMDVNQWKDMFSCMVSKAATVDVICEGEGPNRSGAVQLMSVELQMLTPMVPTRELHFVRCCKQLSLDKWVIVDASIDDSEGANHRRRPSGCVIEDQSNGHCKVTWVEHSEYLKSTTTPMYRTIVNSGLAFGAARWLATLQLQCERLVFSVATNVPTKDSNGVATLAGRKSVLCLAHRMTSAFCRAVSASSHNAWTRVPVQGAGEDMRVCSRANLGDDPGEPIGLIACGVVSIWLPVVPSVILEFLRDETRRREWDVTSGAVQPIANLAKGQHRGNSVTLLANEADNASWILQDGCANAFESMLVYATVDVEGMRAAMTGRDSSGLAVLPCGFSILPDGLESRPPVIMNRGGEAAADGGSLVTVMRQTVVAEASPGVGLIEEHLEGMRSVMSCLVNNIRTSLMCDEA